MATETKSRKNQTVRDLVLSMLVVGGFVAFLNIIVLRPTPDPVRVVDVAAPAAVARTANAFPVLVPADVPSGWRATSARYEPGRTPGTGSWFNGYITPDNGFVAVAQTDHDVDDFVDEQTRKGRKVGSVTIDGQTWDEYESTSGADTKRALVLSTPEVTTVVSGTVSFDALVDFAQRLRTT